jgi:hypothetical protein
VSLSSIDGEASISASKIAVHNLWVSSFFDVVLKEYPVADFQGHRSKQQLVV